VSSAGVPAVLEQASALGSSVDDRTPTIRRRGWLVARMLLLADLIGLALGFVAAQFAFELMGGEVGGGVALETELGLFLLTLPLWIVFAKLYELYDHDEERTDHSTVDDLVGVFHLVTVGTWAFFFGAWLTGLADPNVPKLLLFWAFAIALVVLGRALARAYCRNNVLYLQNTVVVGEGEVGQLVARKLLQHPEYGINLVGFVDAEPRKRRGDLKHVAHLGAPAELIELVRRLDIDRVVFAFTRESHQTTVRLIRQLKKLRVQIDIVPRLFEAVGPNVGVHSVESLPLIGLPTAKLFPFSLRLKRVGDVVGAAILLALTSPLFLYLAWRIRRDSDGPVFFRQTRLGMEMREFTLLKFRTMKVDVDTSAHRRYIQSTMDWSAELGENGVYKLDRDDDITRVGKWLRRTSLDELPQLINVLRGDMSLVGPRPCIPYEVEHFGEHHLERFDVPAGITGLWQVTARAHATFGEALDMDVAYARNWSLGLDLWLLLKTPLMLLRRRGTR
jgi:exopolysaccharide biosynthesis polyprenyl glycosylphosphotransferase